MSQGAQVDYGALAAQNGAIDSSPPASSTPSGQGAVSDAMQQEGVSDYKPRQGVPFGHVSPDAMRSTDITPSQAEGGAAAIAGAAGTTAATAAAAKLPAVIPHTIEGVKAITSWANGNPVQAYLLLQVMKEIIPGAKKAMGIVKDAPTD